MMGRSLVDHWQENSVCVYIKLVNLGFGFGSARTAVESRLWSSQGCRFPSSRAAAVSFASRHVVATTYQERKWRGRERAKTKTESKNQEPSQLEGEGHSTSRITAKNRIRHLYSSQHRLSSLFSPTRLKANYRDF